MALKQSFNINQAKTTTITHQSKTQSIKHTIKSNQQNTIKIETGEALNRKTKTEHTLNNRATHKTTKHYYEPLDHYSPAMAPNLIEAVPESNKH